MTNSAAAQRGLTLLEFLIGTFIVGTSMAALFHAFTQQRILNEHAGNLTWALNDANRVMEELRLRNTDPCTGGASPSTAPPAPFATWDDWLADTSASGGGGKTLVNANEVVAILPVGADPIRTTITVCWTHRNRAIGDCNTADGSISSPAMLSTSITCRQ